jgi:hypothetical protein
MVEGASAGPDLCGSGGEISFERGFLGDDLIGTDTSGAVSLEEDS